MINDTSHLRALMVDPTQNKPTSIATLIAIMHRLRDPERGCPWDLEQDMASLVPYTLEEAYEVADVVTREAWQELPDELGDLLLQVVFYAQLASEQSWFTFEHVVAAICAKLIRRHPHIFGDEPRGSAADQRRRWEEIKRREKSASTPRSLLDDVSRGVPALERALRLQQQAARGGFDWPTVNPVIDKVGEELTELTQAFSEGAPSAMLSEELGDLLFSCVNLARHLNINPEAALRAANAKFERRFRYVEEATKWAPGDHSLAELDAWWDDAKAEGL